MTAAATTVAIVAAGGANIASLQFALGRLGVASQLTTDPAVIRAASHVVLPGVGAARDAMARLEATGLATVLPGLRQPVLGICLGLQLLFDSSEEDGARCLGILQGMVRRLRPAPDRPVPHMGWNQIRPVRECPLLADVPAGSYFYFVHSYAADVGDWTMATAEYGGPFSAVVARDNFVATQFHPERSGSLGARILQNFLTRY